MSDQASIAKQEEENRRKSENAVKSHSSDDGASPSPDNNDGKKWAVEQSRIDHLPMEQRANAQAELHAKMAAAKKDQKPLSLDLPPDEYVGRIKKEREAAIAQDEKAMKGRHKSEDEALARRHKEEADDMEDRRKRLDGEMKAVKANIELWHRQDDEATADPARRDVLLRKYDQERVALVREYGYDVIRPTRGDTTISGFVDHPLPGHPWIRPAV